jgi:serine/threonine-protein kinase
MLKARQKLGKYRVDGRLAEGGFAIVYKGYDTIEGIPVALKVPHKRLVTKATLDDFRKEARLTANLDHPNILPIKNASFIDKLFVIVFPLGEGTLGARLRRRLSTHTALNLAEQMLEATAYAHTQRIVHCDIKPENFIMFPGDRIRLTDFGIAKVAFNTRVAHASGTGTLGYLAPEQALGKPSFRSDVFALGLVLYRMFSGYLPEWPYTWPPSGIERIRQVFHPDFVDFLRRALNIDERQRFRDAIQMQAVFQRIKSRAVRRAARRRRTRASVTASNWKSIRQREFKRRYGKALEIRSECERCGGPLAASMPHCPWCGSRRRVYRGPTPFPVRCRRCGRGMKRDWRFCAWCYGPGNKKVATRQYTDVRYEARCQNPACKRRELMPFMRYCPWCRAKVRRAWKIGDSKDKCPGCGWGVAGEFWNHCPWCGRGLGKD